MSKAKREQARLRLLKAVRELEAARVLASAAPAVLDTACDHCQQAAEKALKGYLTGYEIRPEETHDIKVLLEQAMEIEEPFGSWLDSAEHLTPLAAFAYPGGYNEPTAEDFEGARDDAQIIVGQVLAFLPPEARPSARGSE